MTDEQNANQGSGQLGPTQNVDPTYQNPEGKQQGNQNNANQGNTNSVGQSGTTSNANQNNANQGGGDPGNANQGGGMKDTILPVKDPDGVTHE
jgi:hypothetical protein